MSSEGLVQPCWLLFLFTTELKSEMHEAPVDAITVQGGSDWINFFMFNEGGGGLQKKIGGVLFLLCRQVFRVDFVASHTFGVIFSRTESHYKDIRSISN